MLHIVSKAKAAKYKLRSFSQSKPAPSDTCYLSHVHETSYIISAIQMQHAYLNKTVYIAFYYPVEQPGDHSLGKTTKFARYLKEPLS